MAVYLNKILVKIENWCGGLGGGGGGGEKEEAGLASQEDVLLTRFGIFQSCFGTS